MLRLIGATGLGVLVGCTHGEEPGPETTPSPGEATAEPTAAPPSRDGVVLGASRGVAARLGLASRQYVAWDSAIFDPSDPRTFLLDTTAFLNIKFAPSTGWQKGHNALWEEIASGSRDDRIEEWANLLNQVPRKLCIALHHEPIPDDESGPHEGKAADLMTAVRRVVERWKAAGVQHILTQVLIALQFRDRADTRMATDALDAIGVDGYGDTSRPTADAVFEDTLSYAQRHGKPVVIFETAFRDAIEGDGQQRTYYESLDALLKREKVIRGCALWLSFTAKHDDRLNSEGLAVARRMAADPFYTREFV